EQYHQLFLKTAFDPKEHLQALEDDYYRYWGTLLLLTTSDVHLSKEIKSTTIAAVLAKKDKEIFQWLMSKRYYNMLEIRDAIRLLRGELKQKGKVGYGSGPRKMVKKWFSSLSEEELTNSLTKYSYDAWREVIDLTHSHPSDFQVEWFQKAVYGAPVPENSKLGRLRKFKDASKEEQREIIKKEGVHAYHHLRRKTEGDEELSNDQARVMALAQLIRHHERFNNLEVDKILLERLEKQEKAIHMNFAEFLNRIMVLRKQDKVNNELGAIRLDIANELERLADLGIEKQNINLDYPVALLVDKSASMEEAIHTGVPLAAILASRNPDETKMVLFGSNAEIMKPPSNMNEALSCLKKVKVEGYTCPAAALVEIDKLDFVPKTLVIVTDEGENVKARYHGEECSFSELLEHFYAPRYPRVIFITIGNLAPLMTSSVNLTPLMSIPSLSSKNIPYEKFTVDAKQADFSFVENLLVMVKHSKEIIQKIQEETVAKKLKRNVEKDNKLDIASVERTIHGVGASMFSLGEVVTSLSDLTMLKWSKKADYINTMTEIKVLGDSLKLPEFVSEVEKEVLHLAKLKELDDEYFQRIQIKTIEWGVKLKEGMME
ncbi:MAG: hypothetical protein ACXAEU_25975, partial [Candidatus Hodarchaeales archaeon]